MALMEPAFIRESETNEEMMPLRIPNQTSVAPPFVIDAAGQTYPQTIHPFLGGSIHESADFSFEIRRQICLIPAMLQTVRSGDL